MNIISNHELLVFINFFIAQLDCMPEMFLLNYFWKVESSVPDTASEMAENPVPPRPVTLDGSDSSSISRAHPTFEVSDDDSFSQPAMVSCEHEAASGDDSISPKRAWVSCEEGARPDDVATYIGA